MELVSNMCLSAHTEENRILLFFDNNGHYISGQADSN